MPGDPLRFMHATLGKGYGVVKTDFYMPYYKAQDGPFLHLRNIRPYWKPTKSAMR